MGCAERCLGAPRNWDSTDSICPGFPTVTTLQNHLEHFQNTDSQAPALLPNNPPSLSSQQTHAVILTRNQIWETLMSSKAFTPTRRYSPRLSNFSKAAQLVWQDLGNSTCLLSIILSFFCNMCPRGTHKWPTRLPQGFWMWKRLRSMVFAHVK